MARPYDTRHQIMLDKPKDWDGWISFIKSAVDDPQIWKLIDPDLTNKPVITPYPEDVIPPKFGPDGKIDADDMSKYKALRLVQDLQLAKYKQEQTGLRAAGELIFKTTSARMVKQVAYSDTGLWSKLVAFKQRLRPNIQSSNTTLSESTPTDPEAFTTILYTAFTTRTPGIESFLIHDGGSSVHVCNSASAHLYTKLRDARHDEYLRSGTGTVKIESWGRMKTAWESPKGQVPILLENVAFIGSFVTSLVSQSVLDRKGVHFDTGGPRLYKDGVTKFVLYKNGGHYTFTPTGIPHDYLQNATKASAIKDNTLTKNPLEEPSAHMVMAHVSREAIESKNFISCISKSLGDSNSALAELNIQGKDNPSTPPRDCFTKMSPAVIQKVSSTENPMDKISPETQDLFTPSQTPSLFDHISGGGDKENKSTEDVSDLPSTTKDSSGDLDPSDDLPEGVRRQAKPSTYHDMCSTQLISAEVGSLDIFHNEFTSFAANSLLSDTNSSDYACHIPRAYCDYLPLEPKLPRGFSGGNLNILPVLQKTLYGVKQSSALWHTKPSRTPFDFGSESLSLSGVDCIITRTGRCKQGLG